MFFDSQRHHRRSTRLKGYDYATPGAYYVTICAAQRGLLFGRCVHGVIELNAIGQVIQDVWLSLPRHYPHIALDAFVVMPDHVHGIIVIVDTPAPPPSHGAIHGGDGGDGVGTQRTTSLRATHNTAPRAPDDAPHDAPRAPHDAARATHDATHNAAPHDDARATPDAARTTSTRAHGGAEIPPITPGSLPVIVRAFKSSATRQVNILRQTPGAILWQERYYDHIVRDADDLDRIRRYIANNPIFWRNPHANTRSDDPLR